MSAPRVELSPADQALKVEYGKLVRAVGGVEAAAALSRPGYRRHSEYQRTDNDCFAPLDAVRDLQRVTRGTVGHPIITRYLARDEGYALVKLPDVDAAAHANVHVALAEASSESNDVITGALAALRMGRIDQADIFGLRRECIEAAEAFMRFDALLAQLAEP